jgi:hypothetical protein
MFLGLIWYRGTFDQMIVERYERLLCIGHGLDGTWKQSPPNLFRKALAVATGESTESQFQSTTFAGSVAVFKGAGFHLVEYGIGEFRGEAFIHLTDNGSIVKDGWMSGHVKQAMIVAAARWWRRMLFLVITA